MIPDLNFPRPPLSLVFLICDLRYWVRCKPSLIVFLIPLTSHMIFLPCRKAFPKETNCQLQEQEPAGAIRKKDEKKQIKERFLLFTMEA